MQNKPGLIVAVLFVVALLARIAAGLFLGMNSPLDGDEPDFLIPAESMARGGGYNTVPQQSVDGQLKPTAYRVPLPAMLLAAVYTVTGPSVVAARSVSIVVASFAPPLMFLFARRFLSHPAAVLAGLACAFYPIFVIYSQHALSEPYFIPALLGCLIFTLVAVEREKMLPWLVAGIAWGLTSLIRPHAAPMAALIALYVVFRFGWRQSALICAGVVLCLTPWAIRNYVQLGSPVLLATESGETLLGSNNRYVLDDPKMHGMWISPMQVDEYVQHLKPIQNEVQRNREQVKMGLDFLVSNPGEIPRLAGYKLWRWLTPITASGGLNRIIVLGSYGVLLLLLAIGLLLRAIHDSTALRLALLCSLSMFIVTAVYWGNLTRGRLPLEMLWLPWGAHSAVVIWRKARGAVEPVAAAGLVKEAS